MNSQVQEQPCRTRVSSGRGPTKDVQLEGVQAKRWLDHLERLAPGGEHAHTIADFCNKLDDALWLANWKREYVVMELELAAVPGLIAALVNQEPDWTTEGGLDIQADILATLAKMPRWT